MKTYFISDLHFGHTNLLRFERSEFETIEEHDNFIIETINKTVKLNDVLYILGDIGNADKVRLLNGRKILIMGNHDKRSVHEYRTFFSEVYEHPIYYNTRILLSHYPHPVDQGILNLHGHLHGSWLESDNHFNLSAAMIKYRPVAAEVFTNKTGSMPKNNYKFLEEWHADKYVFAKTKEDVVVDENNKILLKETKELRKQRYQQNDEAGEIE